MSDRKPSDLEGYENWPQEKKDQYWADANRRIVAETAKNREIAKAQTDSQLASEDDRPFEGDVVDGLWGETAQTKPAARELELFDAGDLVFENIAPREWLLGTSFCREFVSGVTAPGAGGKTTIRLAQYLSLASGKPLSGEFVFQRSKVLFICFEDGKKELDRRLAAVMLHHGIRSEDVRGWLYTATPSGMKIAVRDPKTGAVDAGDLDRAIRAAVKDKGLSLVAIDPIVKAHGLTENDNDDMDFVVTLLARIAIEKNIAVDYLAHERKTLSGPGEAGDANRGRGGGALKDGGRLISTLTPMSDTERDTFGLKEEERVKLVRLDKAKDNLTPRDPTAKWFRLASVAIGNGNELYPAGDNIQAAEVWKPPALFDAVTNDAINDVLDKLAGGMPGGRKYSVAASAKDRAAWKVAHEALPDKSEEQCRAMIALWGKNGLITSGPYHDPKERRELAGIIATKHVGGTAE